MKTKAQNSPNNPAENPADNTVNQPTEKEIKYPLVTTENLAEGGFKTTTQKAKGAPITWEIAYPDGKRITFEEDEIEVTRYPKGNIEFLLPKSKKKVSVMAGTGEDMLQARRMMTGKAINEETFNKAALSQLTRIDGKFVPPEDIAKSLSFSDFAILEKYFQEVNF